MQVGHGGWSGGRAPARLTVAITGASMPALGIRLLEVLAGSDIETHLIISRGARRTIQMECPQWRISDLHALATTVHQPHNLAAAVASGSFVTMGMVVIPCSMNTLSTVSHSRSDELIGRAADVTLKESRPLVLVTRESPLHLGHLRNMVQAAEMGARIMPPVLGSYYQPQSIADVVDHLVGRVLDQFGIPNSLVSRWTGAPVSDQEDVGER